MTTAAIQYIALIRGINVGRGKRVAMADLRDLVEGLGHGNVRTVLNSGNVLFHSRRAEVVKTALAIETAISARCGFSASVAVISAKTLDDIIEENPLSRLATDPAKQLVAFVAHPKLLQPLRSLLSEPWTPDALAITTRAAYLWCSAGILDSKLSQTFARRAASSVTARNWSTVLKLQAVARG